MYEVMLAEAHIENIRRERAEADWLREWRSISQRVGNDVAATGTAVAPRQATAIGGCPLEQ